MTRTLGAPVALLALLLSLARGTASAQVRIVIEGSFELGAPIAPPAPAASAPGTAAPAPTPLIAPVAVPVVEEVPEVPLAPAAERRAPRWRLDFGAPGVGMGRFFAPAAGYERAIASLSFDVRFVGAHGHGVMARYATAGNLWGSGQGFEADYVLRVRLAGDDRVGLGLDVMAGLTLASLRHDEGTVPHGFAPGGNASLQLDLRLWGFVISGAVVYRTLVPTDPAPNGGPTGWEHAITGTLGLGFGFWGT